MEKCRDIDFYTARRRAVPVLVDLRVNTEHRQHQQLLVARRGVGVASSTAAHLAGKHIKGIHELDGAHGAR